MRLLLQFLSTSNVEVPSIAPKSTSSRPTEENVGSFLSLMYLYKSFLCAVVILNNGVTKTESASFGIFETTVLISEFTGTTVYAKSQFFFF